MRVALVSILEAGAANGPRKLAPHQFLLGLMVGLKYLTWDKCMDTNTIRNRLLSVGHALLLGLTFFFGQAQAQSTLSYDGIYQWSAGQYLSLHQDGTHMIGTIYFTNDGSYSFPAPAGGGVLPVPQLDLFDLMGGPVTGSTAQMDGTRFHRECNVAYDFKFNNDATITVTRIGVSNTAAANSAHISCSAIVGMEAATMIVPKIRFNPAVSEFPVNLASTYTCVATGSGGATGTIIIDTAGHAMLNFRDVTTGVIYTGSGTVASNGAINATASGSLWSIQGTANYTGAFVILPGATNRQGTGLWTSSTGTSGSWVCLG